MGNDVAMGIYDDITMQNDGVSFIMPNYDIAVISKKVFKTLYIKIKSIPNR